MDFAEFYEQSRDGCLRAVYASVNDRQVAEELVSEAFARAFASWRKVSRHPAPEAWIVRTSLNTGVSRWRRRRREVRWDGQEPSGGDPGESLIDASLRDALRALPVRQREVIALRIFLDLDTQATADALGIAPGTVRAHLHRATAALRERLVSSNERETAR
ncbi:MULTISPECIES: sigma-70 family RNA polymerase sigma factor [Actinomadura]|uniref:Sigma-70 family RNA polymerase sigma factor n=1 Tax=Actinomadura yumaensis TaxID=111807 RepID=A0ABW2CN39_9ACTN|nr:sigma-70 family RNA polymerase sigma factor [Actinomadura sp. J1-007]